MEKQIDSHTQKVVCLVFYKNEKILLEQRLDKDAFHKNWMFTGGKVEQQDYKQNNPIHAAAAREAKEETGLDVIETIIFTTFNQELRDGRKFEFIGLHIDKWEGELHNSEPNRRKLAWVAISNAGPRIGEHEVDQRILNDFLSYLA